MVIAIEFLAMPGVGVMAFGLYRDTKGTMRKAVVITLREAKICSICKTWILKASSRDTHIVNTVETTSMVSISVSGGRIMLTLKRGWKTYGIANHPIMNAMGTWTLLLAVKVTN